MTARRRHPLVIASVLALGVSLAGCESFPIDPSEWFSNKKPLPGERRAVFPEGVPGVPQGVPQELVEGYQPPPNQAPWPASQQTASQPGPSQ